jgi:small subunit ribosomal protein S6
MNRRSLSWTGRLQGKCPSYEARPKRNGARMPLYEHVFISRQDLSNTQAEGLIEHFSTVLADNGGKVVENEYWGVKTMAYKINKNRKGHYAFLKSDAPAAAVQEMERLMRLHEDVMRVLTIKVEAHGEGPSVQMQKRDDRDRDGDRGDRGGFGGGERRERSFGDRPDRGERPSFGGERPSFGAPRR